METRKFRSSLFSVHEGWWTQIPLMLNWGVFPSFTLILTVLCATSWKGTYGHFCSCYSTEQSQSNYFTCKFIKISFPGTLPHGVDGRHQGGSCLAALPPCHIGPIVWSRKATMGCAAKADDTCHAKDQAERECPQAGLGLQTAFWDCQKK